MSGDLLDLVLIALASAFAVAGYRQGFIIGVLSFVGFTGGAVIGIYVAPGIATVLTARQNLEAVLAIIGVFAAAVVGMLVASALGVMIRSHVRGRPSTMLDSIGGAAVNVVAILVLAWMIGSLVAYAPAIPAIAREVNRSILLRSVNRLIPQAALPEFTALRRLLSTQPYVQVFGALGAETALNVPKLDPSVLHQPGLHLDRNSVVKIEGQAPACQRTIEGSGFVISRDHVITNAHVVAGVTDGPEVYTRTVPGEHPARVVLFDPERDIAVLYVPSLDLPALHLAASAPFGGNAIVAGYPLDAAFTPVPARVGRAESASGPDIYNTTRVVRDIYPIRADVQPGNSGGPLIAPNGQVYGMVFAAAVAVPNTGYALTSSELTTDIKHGERLIAGTPTGGCQ
ncbi:MAG TPA: MarP family serine protease [Streptosporangiaceae bacterium]|nr:MarP family serine protease [Streptosporangiaceae bacterium]